MMEWWMLQCQQRVDIGWAKKRKAEIVGELGNRAAGIG